MATASEPSEGFIYLLPPSSEDSRATSLENPRSALPTPAIAGLPPAWSKPWGMGAPPEINAPGEVERAGPTADGTFQIPPHAPLLPPALEPGWRPQDSFAPIPVIPSPSMREPVPSESP
ncbi:MAG TPA: hypothetical protein VIY86_02170, partial [Pirellulaceae bacterium]